MWFCSVIECWKFQFLPKINRWIPLFLFFPWPFDKFKKKKKFYDCLVNFTVSYDRLTKFMIFLCVWLKIFIAFLFDWLTNFLTLPWFIDDFHAILSTHINKFCDFFSSNDWWNPQFFFFLRPLDVFQGLIFVTKKK